jgi:hypothetical protein
MVTLALGNISYVLVDDDVMMMTIMVCRGVFRGTNKKET